MSYFGYSSDLIEHLASECEATAVVHSDQAKQAMLYLATELYRLAPLYEAICEYGMNDDKDATQVAHVLNQLLSDDKKGA